MKTLDPLGIELTGAKLIEASAGTGKTYTITTLFLRLLLEKKVSIDRVLVVTFTVAATEELRIKLSARLHLANQWLRYPDSIDEKVDPTLAELISSADKQHARVLVGDAVARLDDLSVYTIDAMCLRILQDFAFESGLPMRIEMIADDTDIRHDVVRDYWRLVLGSGDGFQIDNLLALARSPDDLLRKLNDLLRRRDIDIVPAIDIELVKRVSEDVKDHYRKIVHCWKNNQRRIQEIFSDEPEALNKNTYRDSTKKRLMDWLKTLSDKLPSTVDEKFHLLTISTLAAKTKKGKVTPTHQFFELCDGFEDKFNTYSKYCKMAAVNTARDYLIKAIDRYKADRGLIHFEDMRTRLDAVLKSNAGADLAAKIRTQWQFALIDEFQDTDAEQFRIFSALYANQPQCGFFMIGDPKQAVYSWRGADVFTYMKAVDQTADSYTLGTNWRSSPAMVNAVNCLFQSTSNSFIFEKIPFHPVDASPSNNDLALIRDGAEVAPLRFSVFERATQEQIAIACASDIAQLLVDGRDEKAQIKSVGVAPADIAILVRSHAEATMMQQALRAHGVSSVSMPNQSVFQSVEASELHQVLQAMAYPAQEGALRAALVTELLGYNSRDMELLLLDELRWEQLIDHFIHARELWLERGFMYALQVLLADLGVAKRILQGADGEQRMTNLLQLAELLQIKAREIASHEELMLWLRKQIDHARAGDDALLLRLESDEDLVQIVTMHKSKGLEYPVVYMPFPMALNTGGNRDGEFIVYHNRENYRATVDLGSEEISEAKAKRLEESLSEELRLLYVAVTRSKSACVLYWGNARNINSSALKHLLYQDFSKLDYESIRSGLSELVLRGDGCIEMTDMVVHESVRFDDVRTARPLALPGYTSYINRRWGLNSYTGLLRGKDADMPDHDELSEPVDQPLDEMIAESELAVTAEEQEISMLPAGARTGQLLHEIFEFMDFTDTAKLDSLIEMSMLRHGQLPSAKESKNTDWAPVIKKIIINSLAATLMVGRDDAKSVGKLRLQEIENKDRLNEMEFFFAVSNLEPGPLDQLLSAYPSYKNAASGLKFSAFEGLMQGFIDMVIRKDNRYCIVDYKSNWLGETKQHYSQDKLSAAISSHRYHLQYLIYTVALHRYLGKRLSDYDYNTHFGGVYYLFVRGMRPDSANGVWFDKPPLELINKLDMLMSTHRSVA